jgi:hypothetical protein
VLILTTSLLPSGCRKSEKELAQARASLLQEIGLPPTPSEAIAESVQPKLPADDPSRAWIDDTRLPLEHWEIQYVRDRPVGFTHRSAKIFNNDDQDPLYELEAESRMRLSDSSQEVELYVRLVTFETARGELKQIQGWVDRGKRSERFEGKVQDGYLDLTVHTDGKISHRLIPWTETDRGPFAIEQSLVRAPMKEGETRELRFFDPVMSKMVDAQLKAFDFFKMPTYEGPPEELQEIHVTLRSDLGEASSQMWVDHQGRSHKTFLPALNLQSFRCDATAARFIVAKSELSEYSLRTIMLFGKPPESIHAGPIRYHVETRDRQSGIHLSSRTNQTVKVLKPKNLKVEVLVYPAESLEQSIEGIEQESDLVPLTVDASPLVNSGHPQIKKWVRNLLEAEGLDASSPRSKQVSALRRGIHESVSVLPFEDEREVGVAHQTLAAGKGDCFDHAVLLAAACRVHQIPSRIAIGLIFRLPESIRGSLHAWVEYHDGKKWIPIDSTLEGDSVGADRIKWGEHAFENINPYDAILPLARMMRDLDVNVMKPATP